MQRNLSFQIMEACCFPTLRPAIRRSFINPVRKKNTSRTQDIPWHAYVVSRRWGMREAPPTQWLLMLHAMRDDKSKWQVRLPGAGQGCPGLSTFLCLSHWQSDDRLLWRLQSQLARPWPFIFVIRALSSRRPIMPRGRRRPRTCCGDRLGQVPASHHRGSLSRTGRQCVKDADAADVAAFGRRPTVHISQLKRYRVL